MSRLFLAFLWVLISFLSLQLKASAEPSEMIVMLAKIRVKMVEAPNGQRLETPINQTVNMKVYFTDDAIAIYTDPSIIIYKLTPKYELWMCYNLYKSCLYANEANLKSSQAKSSFKLNNKITKIMATYRDATNYIKPTGMKKKIGKYITYGYEFRVEDFLKAHPQVAKENPFLAKVKSTVFWATKNPEVLKLNNKLIKISASFKRKASKKLNLNNDSAISIGMQTSRDFIAKYGALIGADVKMKNGNEMSYEIIDLRTSPVDKSVFHVPNGYEVVNLSGNN